MDQTTRSFAAAQTEKLARNRRRNSLFVELLEPRLVLSTIMWSTTAAPTGGDWNVGGNWVGGNVPGSSDTAVIKGLTGTGIVYLNSGGSNLVNNLTTDSSTQLEVESGSLAFGSPACHPLSEVRRSSSPAPR